MRADVTVNLNLRPEVRREWENLRKHDVCFLLTVRPPSKIGTFYDFHEPFVPQVSFVWALHITHQTYTSALCCMLVLYSCKPFIPQINLSRALRFVIGVQDKGDSIMNLALDRIQLVDTSDIPLIIRSRRLYECR